MTPRELHDANIRKAIAAGVSVVERLDESDPEPAPVKSREPSPAELADLKRGLVPTGWSLDRVRAWKVKGSR
jgi:hypothetical protein